MSEDLASQIIPITIYIRDTKKIRRTGMYCSFPNINILKKHFGEDNVTLSAGN